MAKSKKPALADLGSASAPAHSARSPAGVVVAIPFDVLVEHAWKRIEAGDKPCFEEVTRGNR